MNLIKWFRKSNKKIMAVMVVIIMFGFIGGSYIQQLGNKRSPLHRTIAYFANKRKITNYDLAIARQELEILQLLRAPDVLRSRDLQMSLLGELLFADRRTSPRSVAQIKQVIKTNNYGVSEKQINDIYTGLAPKDICWLMLTKEAEQAGIRVSNDSVKHLLANRVIPPLFQGARYSQVIGIIMNQHRVSEDEILTTFGKLLAVLEYSRMLCLNETVTSSQLAHDISLENETIAAEFVRFGASVFAERQSQPGKEKMTEHFDRYKKFFEGEVSDENPYGFGYKLDDKVKLEYIVLKLNDVAKTISRPTAQETEQYYQQRREQFTEQIPADPNDPNSTTTERTKSYAEVAADISKYLFWSKINLKAESILQQAKTLASEKFDDMDDIEKLSPEQFKQLAGDYQAIAAQLNRENKIKIFTGKTGPLSAAEMQFDEHLGKLYLMGYGYNMVRLPRIVFAVDQVATSELGAFDVPKPRMYETIGPLKDTAALVPKEDLTGQIMAVVKVIEANKAVEPENIHHSFSQETITFDTPEEQTDRKMYSVAEKVADDLKTLAAMETAKDKTTEFIKQVVEDGWSDAIDKFSQLYGSTTEPNEGEPNTFELRTLANLPRLSNAALDALAVQSQGSPVARRIVNGSRTEALLRDRLYSIVPKDANTIDTLPYVMKFKPDRSYYCLKNISVKRLDQTDFERIKARQADREDFNQSQSLAAVHFNPENILKRMGFRRKPQDEQPKDANTPSTRGGMP